MELDYLVIFTTFKLAGVVTLALLVICVPLSWWLAMTKSRFHGVIESIVSLPLVLPPTVLGFYLLLLLSPKSVIGEGLRTLGIEQLPFTFAGIAVACTIHSIPFVIQPLKNAFRAIGKGPLEAAATLRATPLDSFFSVTLPLAWPGIFSAALMGFCHTLGEFGVVLMIGGNIPGQTRVMSVEIYNYVEALEYEKAHVLAAGLVTFSLLALLTMHWLNNRSKLYTRS